MGKIQGSHKEWGDIWVENAADETRSCQFTKDTPKDIYQFWQKCYYEDLAHLIKDKNYKKFLELGAGKGTTSMYLANNGTADITLVDLSESGFELARKNFQQEGLKVPEMIVANCEDTQLPEESYDCIYNIGLLEHFEDPKPTIRETYRLLSPGGMEFMPIVPKQPFRNSIPARLKYYPISILKHYVKSMLGMNKRKKQKNNMVRTPYGADEYLKICRAVGFGQLKCIPYNPYWLVHAPGEQNYQKLLNDYIQAYENNMALSKDKKWAK